MSVHKYRTRTSDQDRWIVRWRDESGKQLSRGGFRKKGQAASWERDNVLAAKLQGEPTPGASAGGMTVAQWADKFFAEGLGGRSAATQDSYFNTYSSLVHERVGGNTLEALGKNTVIVDSWLSNMRADGTSESNIRHGVAVLSAMCTYAQRQGVIRRNPCRGLMLPQRTNSKTAPMLSTLGVELLAQELRYGAGKKGARTRSELDRARDALFVLTVAYAGCRPPSEVLALRWEDVRAKTLRVDERLYDGVIEARLKRGNGRSIPLQPFLADLFAEVKEIVNPTSERDLIWPADRDGNPWGMSLTRSWRRNRFYGAANALIAKDPSLASTFEDVVPYSGRHHFISTNLAAGIPIFTVAQQAGTSVAMIEQTYGHVIAELHDSPPVTVVEQRAAVLAQLS